MIFKNDWLLLDADLGIYLSISLVSVAQSKRILREVLK
jgi:hypothetical protein